jgi:hypothetical protein
LGRLTERALGVGETTVFEDDAFGGEEAEFFGECSARGMALEAADGQIGRDDAVAGDLRGEGVGAEGLSDGAGRGAADPATEGGISDNAAGRDFFQRRVDFGGEGGGGEGVFSFQ